MLKLTEIGRDAPIKGVVGASAPPPVGHTTHQPLIFPVRPDLGCLWLNLDNFSFRKFQGKDPLRLLQWMIWALYTVDWVKDEENIFVFRSSHLQLWIVPWKRAEGGGSSSSSTSSLSKVSSSSTSKVTSASPSRITQVWPAPPHQAAATSCICQLSSKTVFPHLQGAALAGCWHFPSSQTYFSFLSYLPILLFHQFIAFYGIMYFHSTWHLFPTSAHATTPKPLF